MLAIGVTANSTRAQPWTAGWKRLPDNPTLSLSDLPAFDAYNIFAPAIVKHDGTYFLFYSGGPNAEYTAYQLGLAVSRDGVRFEKTGEPLLPLGERDDFHAAPALLRDARGDLLLDDDGLWRMVYCGNRADDVELATSRDGRRWTKDPRSPIYRRAYAPCLLRVGDAYWMYYVHKPDEGNWEIYLATGADLYSLAPHPANPIVTNTQAWEARHLFYPYVFQDDGVWVMLYAGYWNNPAMDGRFTAIGAATSDDGVHWKKNPANPIFTPDAKSTYDSVYTSSQSVLRDGDIFRMFYAGRVDGKHKYFSIGQAVMPR